MRKKWWKNTLIVGLGITVITLLVTSLPSYAQTPGQNLLVDGDFEAPPPWPAQDGIGEVQVAPGWRAWYLDSPPSYVQPPTNCAEDNQPHCYWMRPEFRDNTFFPNRIHSGQRSQKYFSFGRMHEGGLMQHVTGVTPGVRLRFSIYMQAWMCYNPDDCGKYGERSDMPSNMHLRVGIDPYGGSDPFSPNIVWSPELEAFDRWVLFSVEATARAYGVTVFTHSRADWDWPRQANDVYVDDASLMRVVPGMPPPGQPEATPTPPPPPPPPEPPTAAPASTPEVTNTPLPDSTIVHIVQAGDTLFSIALLYGVPLDELYRLNNLTPESILYIGQELVVGAGEGVVTPTRSPTATPPPPTETATEEVPASPTQVPSSTSTSPPPTATPEAGSLCLSAFEDTNGNNLHDGDESGLPGVKFVILSASDSELEARYETDNLSQAHCLAALPPGIYSVQITPPPGYVVRAEKVDMTLAGGQQVDLPVAVRRGEKPTPTLPPTKQVQPTPTPAPTRTDNMLLTVGMVSIGTLLILASLVIAIVRKQRK